MDQKLRKEPLGKGFYVNVTPHHTFGTDAVLLSSFAHPKKKDKLVDLGTGCGIIPLLMLRDGNLKEAVGVDISEEATTLAQKTKEELQLSNFAVINSDLKDLKGKVEFGCNTLVTCNPPYMEGNWGFVSPNDLKAIARHELYINIDDVVKISSYLLKFGGYLSLVHKSDRLCDIICSMRKYNIEPKRIRFVHSHIFDAPKLVLVEGIKGAKKSLKILNPLCIYNDDGTYTDEVKKLYSGEN